MQKKGRGHGCQDSDSTSSRTSNRHVSAVPLPCARTVTCTQTYSPSCAPCKLPGCWVSSVSALLRDSPRPPAWWDGARQRQGLLRGSWPLWGNGMCLGSPFHGSWHDSTSPGLPDLWKACSPGPVALPDSVRAETAQTEPCRNLRVERRSEPSTVV